jgi:L-cystine uptake protein TcyP (sodium:dicarboxylate symporter family)
MARNVLAILLGTTAISAAVGYLSAIAFGLNGAVFSEERLKKKELRRSQKATSG